MSWDAVTALCAAVTVIASAFTLVTRYIVRDEIRKLNGTYLRTEIAEARFREIENHFDYLRDAAKKHRAENHAG